MKPMHQVLGYKQTTQKEVKEIQQQHWKQKKNEQKHKQQIRMQTSFLSQLTSQSNTQLTQSSSHPPTHLIPTLQQLKLLPRMILKCPKIKIQCKTQFPLIKSIAVNQFGWTQLSKQDHKELVDLLWTDSYVTQELVNRLRPYQKVNHFPYSNNMGRKDFLFQNLNQLKLKYQKQYDFFPKTWIFPNDIQKFTKDTEPSTNDKFFIVKPVASCQGKGIYLSKRQQIVDSIGQNKLLIQQYIEDPLLIDGLKFDLRIYVLITSLDPLKIYIYRQGLTRLATNAYCRPSQQNYRNGRMHLTNYAINKNNPQFIQNNDFRKDNIGHKRSLHSFYTQIQKLGGSASKLKYQINHIIIKTILSVYQSLRINPTTKHPICHSQKCFQLLGFDIMLTKQLKPILLQINHQPSLQTSSPLDFVIKKYLIIDLFNIIDLKPNDKETYLLNKKEQSDNQRLIKRGYTVKGKRQACTGQQQLGGFQQVYPTNNQEYKIIYHKIMPMLHLNQIKTLKTNLFQTISSLRTPSLPKGSVLPSPTTSLQKRRKSYNCNYISMLTAEQSIPQQTYQKISSHLNVTTRVKSKVQEFIIPKKNLNFSIKCKRNKKINNSQLSDWNKDGNDLNYQSIENQHDQKQIQQHLTQTQRKKHKTISGANFTFYNSKLTFNKQQRQNQYTIQSTNPRHLSTQTNKFHHSSVAKQKNKWIQAKIQAVTSRSSQQKPIQPNQSNNPSINPNKDILFKSLKDTVLVKTSQLPLRNQYMDIAYEKQLVKKIQKMKSMKEKLQTLKVNRLIKDEQIQISRQNLKIQRIFHQDQTQIHTQNVNIPQKHVYNQTPLINQSLQMFKDSLILQKSHFKHP